MEYDKYDELHETMSTEGEEGNEIIQEFESSYFDEQREYNF